MATPSLLFTGSRQGLGEAHVKTAMGLTRNLLLETPQCSHPSPSSGLCRPHSTARVPVPHLQALGTTVSPTCCRDLERSGLAQVAGAHRALQNNAIATSRQGGLLTGWALSCSLTNTLDSPCLSQEHLLWAGRTKKLRVWAAHFPKSLFLPGRKMNSPKNASRQEEKIKPSILMLQI